MEAVPSQRRAREGHKESPMLKVYGEMLEAVREMRGMIGAIEKHDADLGRQLRRAASSVVLNVA
jgi:hypothetical protein